MAPYNLTGKIKSVSVKNFVTYEQCVFKPSEFLNVIIGPNGTGKSTLVAAIVIGFGGDPKLLNRSTSVQDYVKNGKTEAHIAIKIYGDKEGIYPVFERHFNSQGKSEFQVNKETMTKTKYIAAVAAFKIQIGNLCQFLPQDKVHDFTKMNPQELFVNTIKSVCDEDEIKKFNELKSLRLEHSTRKERLARDIQNLRNNTARVEELKVVLERHTRRKEFIDKINICTAKQNWLEIDELEEKMKAQTQDKDKAKKLVMKAEKEHAAVKQKQDAVVHTKAKLKKEADRQKCLCNQTLEDVITVENSTEEYTNKIKAEKRSFEMSKKENLTALRELRNESAIFEGITQDLQNVNNECGSIQNCNKELQGLLGQMQKFHTEITNRMKKCTEINNRLDEQYSSQVQLLKSRIDRATNVKDQKLQFLKTKFPKVFTAVQWLQQNQNLCRGKVYLPMLMELNVIDPKNAKYAENTISLRDLLAFICEDKSDVSLLINELCVKQKLGINVAHSLPANACNYKAIHPIESLNQYGFDDYLIDLIEGPASILNYLCSLYNLHKIPIGDDRVGDLTDNIPTNIPIYFGGNKRYHSLISKYSGDVNLMQSHIDEKKLLCSVDLNLVETMKRDLTKLLRETDILKNERSSIESEIKGIEVQSETVRAQKRTIETKILKIKQTLQKLDVQKQKVQRLKDCVIDLPEAEKTYLEKVKSLIKCKIGLQKDRIKNLSLYQKSVAEKKYAQNYILVYNQQSEDLESQIRDVNERRNSIMQTFDNLMRTLHITEKKYNEKLSQAKAATKGYAPKDRNFPFQNEFRSLPNTINELKEEINEYNARLECMSDIDENLIKEFEDKSAEIEILRTSISDIQNEESGLQSRIVSLFEEWITHINEIVETLNQQFGGFMTSMKFVGEISLTRKEEHDFDSYGIQIMVQYRKEVRLQALDRYTQSGGERAVAIAVYTLSLQHITHVPFRCVDEINQGMDSSNERKIFEMLVQETTKNGRSQYFFVTPKLLPGLMHNERMMVHIVFNGKFVKCDDAI